MTRRRILFAALLLAVLGILAYFVFRGPREPVYDGKPLSYWLAGLMNPISELPKGSIVHQYDPEYDQAARALQHIGTNAMPFLIPMLRARDSSAKIKVMNVTEKIPFLRGWPEPASTRQLRALNACMVLGRDAEAAVPALGELVVQSKATSLSIQSIYAFKALKAIDSEAARKALSPPK